MKPFNLEEAKQGKPVCTRSGLKVKILTFDLLNKRPIVAAVRTSPDIEITLEYYSDGRYTRYGSENYDLFMAEGEDEKPKCQFKPFDKVLVRDTDKGKWECNLFEHYAIDEHHDKYLFKCLKYDYAQCIPYNEETAHLVGTTDDAPEKYIIW